jgi:hypothetical protein
LKGLASELTQMVFFSKFKWPSPFQHKKVSFSELMPGESTAVAIPYEEVSLLLNSIGRGRSATARALAQKSKILC